MADTLLSKIKQNKKKDPLDTFDAGTNAGADTEATESFAPVAPSISPQKIEEPSPDAGQAKVNKSLEATKEYISLSKLPKNLKGVFNKKLDSLNEEWQAAQSKYEKDQDRVEFGKMLDLLARSLGQIGAGLYGLQNGVDAVTGLKFNPIDWSDSLRRIEGDRDIAFKKYLSGRAETKEEFRDVEREQRELERERKATKKETEAEDKFTDKQLRAELKDQVRDLEKRKSAMQLASAYISADPARAKDRPRLIQGLREEMAKAGIDAQEQDKVLTREASFFGLIQGKEQIDPEKLSNEIRSRVSQFNSELDRLKKLRYSPTRLTEQQVRSPESQPAPSQEKPSIDISKLPAVVEMVKPNGDIIEVPKKDIERALRGGATFPKGKYE